ncbi:hypothetical protein PR202_gb28308 [Eleusine coracana subsp. coracana]|uniref:Oberon PHD finger domain-containing protein n=1 Tax=Eleusine coracana subsp. coracana TaxID=191504 RepID=A0AAV5FW22_ELECO|nr:hypothetical protein PR202_gb28308 [Eleusine coracana subsp. coracana]
MKKLEDELGPITGTLDIGHGLVCRLAVHAEVQKLCICALESLQSLFSGSLTADLQIQRSSITHCSEPISKSQNIKHSDIEEAGFGGLEKLLRAAATVSDNEEEITRSDAQAALSMTSSSLMAYNRGILKQNLEMIFTGSEAVTLADTRNILVTPHEYSDSLLHILARGAVKCKGIAEKSFKEAKSGDHDSQNGCTKAEISQELSCTTTWGGFDGERDKDGPLEPDATASTSLRMDSSDLILKNGGTLQSLNAGTARLESASDAGTEHENKVTLGNEITATSFRSKNDYHINQSVPPKPEAEPWSSSDKSLRGKYDETSPKDGHSEGSYEYCVKGSHSESPPPTHSLGLGFCRSGSEAESVLDPAKCRLLSVKEKKELIHELSKSPGTALELMNKWTRRDIMEILCVERCSCCICFKYDDNKDPSLWLFCTSDESVQEDSCGLSCHLECALKDKRSGILQSGSEQSKKLDGGYYCTHCGKQNDLLGCWKKQLLIAKNARRLDELCYRILLSHKLLVSTEKYLVLHAIVDTAMKKLEAEVGPITGTLDVGHDIVGRFPVGVEVQKLCTCALETLHMFSSALIANSKNQKLGDLRETESELNPGLLVVPIAENEINGSSAMSFKSKDDFKTVPSKPEIEPGNSSNKSPCVKLAVVGKKDESSEASYEYYIKVMRWLECEGHIEAKFRMKFLTWFCLRATLHEKRTVGAFVDNLLDDPLATQSRVFRNLDLKFQLVIEGNIDQF